jgi:vacuolar-type H+-ATPase subunit F/Vma7
MNYEICVIGNEAMLFPFLQFGFTTYTPPSDEALCEFVQALIDKNYGIVYIEDSYCFKVEHLLEKCRFAPTPIFIPLGENAGGESYYEKTVRRMTESAIGMNVL